VIVLKSLKYSIFLLECLFLFSAGYSQVVTQSYPESLNLDGTTVVEEVYSPGLKGNLLGDPSTQRVKVYLPPGYDDYPDNRYPVIYLLHGHAQNYNTFYSYGILSILNEFISNKTIEPVIVVTPNGNNKYTGCMYTNSFVSGNWEDYITQDVLQYMERNYRILSQKQSRGLGGFSSGGYGCIKLAMKHPSVYSSICTIGISITSFKEKFLDSPGKETIIAATKVEKWDTGLPTKVKNRWSNAVAFAPDSIALPVLGRFPFTENGSFVDSTWQLWLMHDPFTMLQTCRDSLSDLSAIQMYVGNNDFTLSQNEIFHQALMDHGINHGYQIYSGAHDPKPVLDNLLKFFSEHLIGVVPALHMSSDYYLKRTDTLIVETNMDGSIYVVPLSTNTSIDSILKYQVTTTEAIAEQEVEIPLADIETGKYRCFAVSNMGGLSMLSGEFWVIPDAPPELNLDRDTVNMGEPIRAMLNEEGTIYLVWPETPKLISEIRDPDNLIDSTEATGDVMADLSTVGLEAGEYWIYAANQFEILSGSTRVWIQDTLANSGVQSLPSAGFTIFPNPVKNILNITSDGPVLYDIEITNLSGRLLYKDCLNGSSNQADLSFLGKGVYFLTIRSEEFVGSWKIIKL
jgi:S-formylglutathione hydrolase FrmB